MRRSSIAQYTGILNLAPIVNERLADEKHTYNASKKRVEGRFFAITVSYFNYQSLILAFQKWFPFADNSKSDKVISKQYIELKDYLIIKRPTCVVCYIHCMKRETLTRIQAEFDAENVVFKEAWGKNHHSLAAGIPHIVPKPKEGFYFLAEEESEQQHVQGNGCLAKLKEFLEQNLGEYQQNEDTYDNLQLEGRIREAWAYRENDPVEVQMAAEQKLRAEEEEEAARIAAKEEEAARKAAEEEEEAARKAAEQGNEEDDETEDIEESEEEEETTQTSNKRGFNDMIKATSDKFLEEMMFSDWDVPTCIKKMKEENISMNPDIKNHLLYLQSLVVVKAAELKQQYEVVHKSKGVNKVTIKKPLAKQPQDQTGGKMLDENTGDTVNYEESIPQQISKADKEMENLSGEMAYLGHSRPEGMSA